MDFRTLATKGRASRGLDDWGDRILLSFDPGHTTGWCVFGGFELIDAGQLETKSIGQATRGVAEKLGEFTPDAVMMEDYRIYRWRQKHHVGSELLTTQILGCIKTLCAIHGTPTYLQPAHIAKKFCTDKRLKEWGFWQLAERHANDAIRHACYFLVFGPLDRKSERDQVG